jgi:hypothetical protein
MWLEPSRQASRLKLMFPHTKGSEVQAILINCAGFKNCALDSLYFALNVFACGSKEAIGYAYYQIITRFAHTKKSLEASLQVYLTIMLILTKWLSLLYIW